MLTPVKARIDPRMGINRAGIPAIIITVPAFSARSHASKIRFTDLIRFLTFSPLAFPWRTWNSTWSNGEIRRLYGPCPDYLKPIVALGVATGMRKGETLNLKWPDVDFRRKIITILRIKGQGKREPKDFPYLKFL